MLRIGFVNPSLMKSRDNEIIPPNQLDYVLRVRLLVPGRGDRREQGYMIDTDGGKIRHPNTLLKRSGRRSLTISWLVRALPD